MAVLSTIQYIPTEADTATKYLAQSAEAHGQSNSSESNVMHSETPNISMALAAQFTNVSDFSSPNPADTFTATHFSNVNIDSHMDHQHGPAPSDGETIWYCSECGNGPMGTWYSACPCCGHGYCGYCKVEEV